MKKIYIILWVLFCIIYPLKRNNTKIIYSKKIIIKTRIFSAVLLGSGLLFRGLYIRNNKKIYDYSSKSFLIGSGLTFLITIPIGK